MVDGFGAITWWGFSPALDLQEKYRSLTSKLENLNLSEDERTTEQGMHNFLIIGSGDCRHILKTIAHAYRHTKRDLNIYVVENNLEIYGRDLLLLSIALEPKDRLGLQEKTELFVELFGNSLVRPQASEYLQQKSNEFIRMITDCDYLEAYLPVFDFSQLKFKERDQLESIFKFWRNTDPKLFDICQHWEERLRQYFASRYDSRQNIFDWDYNMKLSKKASIINSREYKSWREQGVAFELRSDSTYEVSNRSLASGLIIKKDGEQFARRGYWGDIINSPYLAFGTESEEESLFITSNGQHVKSATHVSEYNVTALMHEIMTGEEYVLPKIDEKKTAKKEKTTLQEVKEEDEEKPEEKQEPVSQSQDYIDCPGIKVYFLPVNSVPDLSKKSKYNKLFDVIYFSNSMVHLLTPEVMEILADEALVIAETTKFMLDLRPEQMQEYLKKITSMAQSAGCKLREMPPDADFDLTDHCNPPPRYNVLHDPHLKEYFQNAAMRKWLIEKGFVTPSGYVKCTLLEFNLFRQWIRKLKLDRIYQERRRQRQFEKQQWKERLAREELLRDEELYCIVREREQKAREHKERGIKRREADRRKYLKLQEVDNKRREKFEKERKRKKDTKESHREKNLERRKAQKVEDEEKMRKFKIRLLVKRSSEDKQRENLLQQRRQTLVEEKEHKLEETWNRRCSLSLERQEEKRRQEEEENDEHIRNVARRASLVAQQRRKSKVFHDHCLNRRRNTLEKQHMKAQIFLDKLREKKMKDLEIWKQKHQLMRERQAQQERRVSLQNKSSDRRRSRISSVWDLQSSLKREFGIDDNVVYSGVVFAGRTATHRTSVQLDALAEEETSRQIEEVDQFERLLSRLEAEFALREHIHYVVFGIISNAHDVLDLQERLEIARGVPSYVQRIVDAAERMLAAQKIVADVVTGAKDEVQRRASLRSQKALAEDISENLCECAKDIVTAAIVSALRHNKDDREVVAARCLAADAVQAAKASLERLYGVKFEIEVDTEEMLSSLDKCAKEVATAAIISATLSLEMAIRKDDLSVIAARSLARDAVAAAKASLEKLPGVYVELEDEGRDPSMDISTWLVKSARHVAQAVVTSSTRLRETSGKDGLENLAAQSLASDGAVQAGIASIENLYGIKVDSEDKSEQTAKEIAAAAVFSATGSVGKDSKISEVDLAVAARGLASSALDSAKVSIERLYSGNVVRGSKQNTPRMFANLEEAAKHIAAVAVDLATRSLERIAEKNEWDLTFTTRKLVNDVLDSAKASLERLYGITIDPDVELIPSSQETSTSVSLGSILSIKEHEEELRVASRNLASDAMKSAEASLERLYCIVNEMESNIKNTALDISKSLVDSSRNLLQHLEKEGLEIAARDLACSAIESVAKSTSKLYEEESSVHDIVGSDSRLLNAAAKVSTISARASLGELFDRGFIGGVELEEATGYLATHALISAEAMLEKVQDGSTTMDLDLEICKAASELASHAVMSAEGSVARLVQENQPRSSKPGSDHGTLFWKVTMYVEGLINGALRSLGSAGYYDDINDHHEQYEVISYDQACIADAEYGPHVSVTENELYKREIMALKAWRIVHDVLGNAMYIVKARTANNAFFTSAEVRPGNTRFTGRRSSYVHFNETFRPRRDSYVPRETDFLSVAKRPPTPHIRKGRAGTVVSQEIQELEKELAIPSDSDLNTLNASDSDLVQRRTSDPGPGITSEDVSRSEPQQSVSDSKIDSGDQGTSLTEKVSLYEIIKKREGTASCEISPCGSYVVLPHLNPSECSLIAARVESYEVLWNQTKTTTSVTSLPSLSPKGSFVASEAVEQVRQRKESQDRSVPSSSRLPDITSSSSKIAKGSSSTRSLKQSPEHPKRTSSPQLKKSSPKPSPKSSKESAKLPSKPSAEKGPVRTKGGSRRSSSENVTAVSPKSSVKDARHSQLAPGTKNGNMFSPSSSLTRASLSPRVSAEKATLSKPTSFQNQLKSSPKTSILFARASTETTMPSLDKTVASPRVSADKMALTSRESIEKANMSQRVSKDNVTSSPRASKEKIALTPKTSIGKVTPSPRASTDKATMPLRTDKGTVTPSPRGSTENAVLSPGVSNGNVARSPRASIENAALSPRVSKGKVTQSPRASIENAALSPRVSKGKVTQSPRASTENAVLAPRVSKGKVKQSPSMSSENLALTPRVSNRKVAPSPRASTENAALYARVSKEKVMQSSRMSVEDMAISSHSSEENVLVSSRASTQTTTASSGSTVKVPSDVGKEDDKASARSIEEEKSVSTENAIAIFPKTVDTMPSIQPSSSLDSQNVMENTDKTKMAPKESTDVGENLSSATKFDKAVDSKEEQYQENEIGEKSLASVQCVPQRTDVFQQQGVGLELDRHDVNKDRTYGDAEETKENEITKNLKNLVPSLERIIQDKRLTPEGAEAETRPASSIDVLASKKYTDPVGLQRNIPVKQAPSDNVKPSLSKSLSSATDSTVGGKISEQGSCRYSQDMTLTKASDEDKIVTPRKKPEGEDTSEGQGVPAGVGSICPEGEGEKRESVSKMPDASTPESKHVPDANQQFIRSPRDVNEFQGYPTYRKVSISRSIHDTVDDIVQRMLSTADEPSAVEPSGPSARGSREEMKRDSKTNFDAPRTFGRGRRLPIGKVSNTVIDTVDFMLQSVSASDERRPHQSSGRTFSGSDIPPGYDVPRTASSMERFSKRTSSTQQGISCVYGGISPSPPKLPSPKRSRLRATSSQDSLEVRVTQSDSSIVSSSSNKSADLKPKVSGAWLDDVTVRGGDASVRSQSPKRPHSSPSSSLHRRSSGRLSVRHSLEGVSMETDTALGKAT